MTLYSIPKNEAPIDALYAVICRDADGNEGIIAALSPPFGSMPLVFSSEERVKSIRLIAKQISKETGRKLYIVKYSVKEVIETIDNTH